MLYPRRLIDIYPTGSSRRIYLIVALIHEPDNSEDEGSVHLLWEEPISHSVQAICDAGITAERLLDNAVRAIPEWHVHELSKKYGKSFPHEFDFLLFDYLAQPVPFSLPMDCIPGPGVLLAQTTVRGGDRPDEEQYLADDLLDYYSERSEGLRSFLASCAATKRANPRYTYDVL